MADGTPQANRARQSGGVPSAMDQGCLCGPLATDHLIRTFESHSRGLTTKIVDARAAVI